MSTKREPTAQERHMEIVRFLRRFEQYSKLEAQPERITNENLKKLTSKQIMMGVVAFCDVSGLASGSAGDHDLYQLLNRYLLDNTARQKINSILSVHG